MPSSLATLGRRHLSMGADALTYRNGDEAVRAFSWTSIERATLALPTSRFRFPGAVSALFTSIVVAVVAGDPEVGPKDGEVAIRIDGQVEHLPLSRHHFFGYWFRTVAATQRLLDRLDGVNSDAAVLATLTEPKATYLRVSAEVRGESTCDGCEYGGYSYERPIWHQWTALLQYDKAG
ncbi:hypothetical protein [Microbacterium sp.]|uniref:hypothetical protein n=1 Tax=Microbacterium sp. TaxID=51671 RepID=UPI003A850F32